MGDRLRVAVIGAGIGGLCLGQHLRLHGIEVAIFERDAAVASRWDGYRIHVNPAGSRSLRACLPDEQWRSFLATAAPGGRFSFVTDQLQPLVEVEEEVMYPGSADDHFAVDRRRLRQVLMDGIGSAVRFGSEFIGYELRSDGVRAHFADGHHVDADVLVAADGTGSRVRRQLAPALEPLDIGVGAYAHKVYLNPETQSWVPKVMQRGMVTVLTDAPAFLFTAVFDPAAIVTGGGTGGDAASGSAWSQPYLLAALVMADSMLPDNADKLQPEEIGAESATVATHWHPTLRRLLAESAPNERRAIQFRAAPTPLAGWPAGPVVLLGDAFHAMPPIGGLGGNTAMRDAHLLGQQLGAVSAGRTTTLQSALADYQMSMRQYGTEAVDSALAMGHQGLRSGRLANRLAQIWLRQCGTSLWLRQQTFRSSWHPPAKPLPWELKSPMVEGPGKRVG